MKKLLKPASLIFIFLTPVVFFVMGIYLAKIFNAGENQGLASGAIVVGWGVTVAGIAFILSVFTAYHVIHKVIVRLNFLLLFIAIILYGITHYFFIQRLKEKENSSIKLPSANPISPISESIYALTNIQSHFHRQSNVLVNTFLTKKISREDKMGVGFFKPDFFNESSLSFYGNINRDKPVSENAPQDSITFQQTQYGGYDIKTAPPYFFPEHLKLDYDMLFLKIIGVGHYFMEVEVNRQTGQTAFVDRSKGDIMYWPDFLLSINSVAFLEGNKQMVRIKPLNYASEVKATFTYMRPSLIKAEWMKVDLLDINLKKVNEGWIKWVQNNKMLISYSLLS